MVCLLLFVMNRSWLLCFCLLFGFNRVVCSLKGVNEFFYDTVEEEIDKTVQGKFKRSIEIAAPRQTPEA